MSTRNPERTGGLGRPQYAERLAEVPPDEWSRRYQGHSGALTDTLGREEPAERKVEGGFLCGIRSRAAG